ncbi:DUF5783 family protein [Halococcus sp. AFM35]|uniref:DUF5783 family protein n=1 Tax=Halococcus sp. AFM35 TaxID=3421653 RepID=UPI003EBFDC77
MTEFSPEQFEDKYANYFPELQTAYRNAFESMSERYDSELIHAIDQQVLNESEPFYDEDGFRIELPENPHERLSGTVVGEEKFEGVLAEYVETLEGELRNVFDLDEGSPKV